MLMLNPLLFYNLCSI